MKYVTLTIHIIQYEIKMVFITDEAIGLLIKPFLSLNLNVSG